VIVTGGPETGASVITTPDDVAEQPPEFVTDTEYVPAADTVID
jgi:hypothetical protein